MTKSGRHEAHDRLLAEILLTRRRLDRLDERLAELGDDADDELAERGAELDRRCETLRENIASWADVEIGVPTAVEDFVAAVDAFESDLEAVGQHDAESYEIAVDRQVRTWRARLERLRIQGALGAMEARDEVDDLTHRLDRVRGDVLVQLQNALGDARDLVTDLRSDVEEVLADVRRAVEKAAADLTDR